jgi:hypothetical protein
MKKDADAPKCPKCGHPSIPIVYGMPGPELFEEAKQGKVALGGCQVFNERPAWECTGRKHHEWGVAEI